MLYKYLPPARIDVLLNASIRFSQIESLNDPFESMIIYDNTKDLNEQISAIKDELEKIWNSTSNDEKTEENYAKLIAAQELICEKYSEKLSSVNLGKEISKLLSNNIGILSLSRNNSNLLMWAHYGKNHQGFVIGFDETNDFFMQKDLYGDIQYPRNVEYSKTKQMVNMCYHNWYERLLCQKSIDWAYEEEVRVFRVLTGEADAVDDRNSEIFLFPFPCDCVKEIIVGCNASEEHEKEIIEITKKYYYYADIFRAKMAEKKYELNLESIK